MKSRTTWNWERGAKGAGSAHGPPKAVVPGPPASGQLVAGKYRFERVIGEGAMGTVISAHHELLDVSVAVKLLSADLARQPDVVERFLREARSAARLKSEHVARVMDVGTLETGRPFIVMELLEGEDLERRLARVGRVPTHEAVDYVLQALEAIAQAHAMGIVHRDLKPANLFATQRPDGGEIVKVLDFGVAKFIEAKPDAGQQGRRSPSIFGEKRFGALTGEHAVLGSPSFMSPEQVCDSSHIDCRADLWAIGVILYELVTGTPAFDGQSVNEIFVAVLHSSPMSISARTPDAAALEEIVSRCLERDPGQRWGDAAQLARALAPLGSGAWAGHVNRIEQTLARAGKRSDPEGTCASAKFERADRPTDPGRVHPPPAGSTFPPPPVFMHASRVGATARVAGGALVALATAAIVLAAVHTRPRHPATTSLPDWPRASATSGRVEVESRAAPSNATPMASALSPTASATPSASATAFPSPTASASAAPSALVSHSAPRLPSEHGRPAPAHVSTGPVPKYVLPAVLDSPD